MFTKKHMFLFLCLLFIGVYSVLAQNTNSVCSNPKPFCTGQVMTFTDQATNSYAPSGPSYGCLGLPPFPVPHNPSFYFMQIANSGSMVISIAGSTDVDFVCWGPFPTLAGVCNSLTANKLVDCGSSPAATETCIISNAVAGQFYLLLLSNFYNNTQVISFQQQNAGQSGAATTNCGVLCGITATNSGLICPGQTNTLSMITTSSATSYTWFGPNGFASTSYTPVVSGLSVTSTFSLIGTINSTINSVAYTNTCQAVTTVSVLSSAVFSVSPASSTAICQNGNLNASAVLSGTLPASAYSFTWLPFTGGGISSPSSQSTNIAPLPLPANNSVSTIIYSVIVSPSLANCPVTQTLAVTINNPSNPTLSLPPPLCNTAPAMNLVASPVGGTWTAISGLTASGFFNPALANIGTSNLLYSHVINNCPVSSSGSISVSKFNTAAIATMPGTLCANNPSFNLLTIVQNTVGTWSGPSVNNNVFSTANLATGNYALTYSTQSSPIASVCPSSSVYSIPVFKPAIPIILPIAEVCNTSPSVALTSIPGGATWLGSGISAAGIQFPSQNAVGVNVLTCTAGQGTCTASNTQTFLVSQFNTAALTTTLFNVCAPQGTVNLMSKVQNTINGGWQGSYVSNNIFTPPLVPGSNYVATYTTGSSPNMTLCPDVSTMVISVYNPPIPNITAAGPYCSNHVPVQLTVTPNTGTWTASAYINQNGVLSPTLCGTGNNLVQYSTGNASCSAQTSALIMVENFLSASLNSSIPDQCNTGSVFNLANISNNANGVWSGAGISGTMFNPVTTGSGSFVLTYKTSSLPTGLCTDVSTLQVNVYSLNPPVLAPVGPLCNNALPKQINVNTLGGTFWGDNNNVSGNGVFNPAYAAIGRNIVSYSISSGPCVAVVQTTVMVEKFVSAGFEKTPPTLCANGLPVNMESFVTNAGGKWTGPGMIGSMFNPQLANAGKHIFLHQTNSLPTATLCPDTQTLLVNVLSVTPVTATTSLVKGCAPLEVLATLPGVPSGVAVWNFGDKSEPETGFTSNHVYSVPGTYSITLTYNDAGSCQFNSSQAIVIQVFETPKADFTLPEEILISDPIVQAQNKSTLLNSNFYTWTVDGAYSINEINPVFKFDKAGNYVVHLKATTVNNCVSEISKVVEVKNDFNLFIPNSFSPNSDGLNDEFLPISSSFGLDLNFYELEVFDRWGQSLFYTKDIHKGWNGLKTGGKAEEAKEDVYVYKIHFKDQSGKTYYKTGTVTLLK